MSGGAAKNEEGGEGMSGVSAGHSLCGCFVAGQVGRTRLVKLFPAWGFAGDAQPGGSLLPPDPERRVKGWRGGN